MKLEKPSIYITGASCSGVTTLGSGLASALGARHVDCDDFYWYPTNPPFSTKRPPADRVRLIKEALGEDGWVLSGSFDGWGDTLIENVNLIVFVYTPTPIRMERLWRGNMNDMETEYCHRATCTKSIPHSPLGLLNMTNRIFQDGI